MAVTTSTALEMLETMPIYYHGNDLAERMIQAAANAIDRLEAHAEDVRRGLVPSLADDSTGLLGAWEDLMELPVESPEASVDARRAILSAHFSGIGESSAISTLKRLREAARTESIVVKRNTPENLVDTIQTPYQPSSYSAAQIERLAERIWPAHRDILMRYTEGFLLDISRLDDDAL